MALVDYIRASAISDDELQDGIASGELQAWRTSADGEVWFKRSHLPMILGVPRTADDAIEAEQVDDFDDDDEDDECVCRDEFGNIEAGSVPPMFLPATGEIEWSE